jgi:hypothetical protein
LKKGLLIIAAIMVLVAATSIAIFLSQTQNGPSTIQPSAQRYLSYKDTQTKIYLLGSTTAYSNINETFTTSTGQIVQKGSPIFIITLILRNDYSYDDPPPSLPNQNPTSPTDGTAYLYLNAQLYNKDGPINATSVSVSDFSLSLTPGTGLVLGSGQTTSVSIQLLTSQTNINKCDVNLVFLGDSIPP